MGEAKHRLYPRSQEKRLAKELFENPTCEYRGAPFWAWNDELKIEELERQIEIFRRMGMGGFHMHVRTGLKTPYLSDAYMDAVRACIDKARKEEMLAYLYDEDRWPSGTCGGKVTREHPEFAQQSLMLTTRPYTPERPHRAKGSERGRGQVVQRQDNGCLMAVWDVLLDQEGCLADSQIVYEAPELSQELTDRFDYESLGKPSPGYTRWYAYIEHATKDPWFNDEPYADTLNPEAVRAFLESTHEVYREQVGDEFGRGTKTIFTDEPQFTNRAPISFAREEKDVFLPWTKGLLEIYEKTYQEALLPRLAELCFELPKGRFSAVRWRFQNLITALFEANFCRQVSDWCEAHQLSLTGHMMDEPRLESQTKAVGDAMRCIAAFGLPGIDMLCDFHEYTTAKQAASAVHQMGREGMMSELYGVTGWDYDFRGHKLQGDWQAALGVTLRVPHLAWQSMQGNAKRDYPASISYQSPWYEKYHLIEDHFARVGTALTRGKPLVKVGVLHPIESFWLLWGPQDQTGERRAQMESDFAALCQNLLLSQMDFDYLNEALLAKEGFGGVEAGGLLRAGEMTYEAVIVPSVLTLRKSTLRLLKAYAQAGGKLILQGPAPAYIDAVLASEEEKADIALLYEKGIDTGDAKEALLSALKEERCLEVRTLQGQRYEGLLYQMRQEETDRWLFITNADNPETPDVDPAPTLRFCLEGSWRLTLYDTMTGEIRPFPAQQNGAQTIFLRTWHMHDSLLLYLEEEKARECAAEASLTDGRAALQEAASWDVRFGKVQISLEEPNALVLDMAEYAVDDEPFQSAEELLRLDNLAREHLGLRPRVKEVVQPYVLMEQEKEESVHKIHLRFRISSAIEVPDPTLALEEPEGAEIALNGAKVAYRFDPEGYFVDKALRTVKLPPLRAGENLLEVTYPLGTHTNLEWLYLLGDFGVEVEGTEKRIVPLEKEIGFGSMVTQGLPFYTGNLTYHTTIRVPEAGKVRVRVPQYRGALCQVSLDDGEARDVTFSPYEAVFEASEGVHTLSFKLYGTRQNAFAQLHHPLGMYFYQSPNSWFTAGDLWQYEYVLKPAGILKSPELLGASFLQADGSIRRGLGETRHHEDLS